MSAPPWEGGLRLPSGTSLNQMLCLHWPQRLPHLRGIPCLTVPNAPAGPKQQNPAQGGGLFQMICLLQGAQYLFDHYISPFLKLHAAKLDPVFASTNIVSCPCSRQCHATVIRCKLSQGTLRQAAKVVLQVCHLEATALMPPVLGCQSPEATETCWFSVPWEGCPRVLPHQAPGAAVSCRGIACRCTLCCRSGVLC